MWTALSKVFDHGTAVIVRQTIDDDGSVTLRFELVGELFKRVADEALFVVTGITTETVSID